MADDKPTGGGPAADALFILGFIAVLIVFWVYTGGPSRSTLKGIFIHPPKPVGQGGVYGPTIASSSLTSGAHY